VCEAIYVYRVRPGLLLPSVLVLLLDHDLLKFLLVFIFIFIIVFFLVFIFTCMLISISICVQ